MPSRRDALKTVAIAATAVPAAFGQHNHDGGPPVNLALPTKPSSFEAGEFATLTKVVDLIIPRTDTPGAADAGVPILIDGQATKNDILKSNLSGALELLDGAAKHELNQDSFLACTEAQQISLLTSFSEAPQGGLKSNAFNLLKSLTIDFYYTTTQGLVQELGWHGNTYLQVFPGCTHPEHQI